MTTRYTRLCQRLARVEKMQVADRTRFQPNPLGPGYLTRNERYQEVIWELRRQIEAQADRETDVKIWVDELQGLIEAGIITE